MRIAVSGTHCSGKSTLIEDFLAAHGDYTHEPEPYVWLTELHGEELSAAPGPDDFYRQLEVSVERLAQYAPGARMLAERSPLDFIAYLLALDERHPRHRASRLLEPAIELASRGLAHLDLLIVLPLNRRDAIDAPEDEDLELRQLMNDHLVELVTTDEYDLLGGGALRIAELHGNPQQRLAMLEGVVSGSPL
ncbi:MAG TPA: AAA family ATPase [Thermoanaerobaculia bacterium]